MKNMDKKQTEELNLEIRFRKLPLWSEIVLEVSLIAVLSTIGPLFLFFNPFKLVVGEIIKINYSENLYFSIDKTILLYSLIAGILNVFLFVLVCTILRPSGIKPDFGKRHRNIISLVVLSIFGWMAFVVLSSLLSSFLPKHPYLSLIIASLLTDTYEILIYKLYFEGKSQSNNLFWEIFRFAIVGLVAAVFDFLTCYVVQFIAFKNNTSSYVTIVSTACGFVIGVFINYLMSTYMVYKASKSGFSKSFKGIVFFVFLSIVGMVIGMLIQTFLYDYLFAKKQILLFSYPVDFVIRTLIVMVYNYVSRKLLIYRN